MFDGAGLPLEENIARTRLVARLAHAAGVDVEAELGRVGDTGSGGEGHGRRDDGGHLYRCRRVGPLHRRNRYGCAGHRHRQPARPLHRHPAPQHRPAARNHARNGIPLVLHGGSGTSEEDFKACIRNGICKINVATAIQLEATDEIRSYLAADGAPNYIDLKSRITEASKKVVAAHIRLFESDGKA